MGFSFTYCSPNGQFFYDLFIRSDQRKPTLLSVWNMFHRIVLNWIPFAFHNEDLGEFHIKTDLEAGVEPYILVVTTFVENVTGAFSINATGPAPFASTKFNVTGQFGRRAATLFKISSAPLVFSASRAAHPIELLLRIH